MGFDDDPENAGWSRVVFGALIGIVPAMILALPLMWLALENMDVIVRLLGQFV